MPASPTRSTASPTGRSSSRTQQQRARARRVHAGRSRERSLQTRLVKGERAPAEAFEAAAMLREVAEAARVCGDPRMQFDTALNARHTRPNSARINAANRCAANVPGRLGLQPRFAEPDGLRDRRRPGAVRRRRLLPRRSHDDHRTGDHRRPSQLPDRGHRMQLARHPAARARLREPRGRCAGRRDRSRQRKGARGRDYYGSEDYDDERGRADRRTQATRTGTIYRRRPWDWLPRTWRSSTARSSPRAVRGPSTASGT